MKGFTAYILKDKKGDCSNFGISSKCDKVTIIDENVPAMYEPTKEAPAVKIVRRTIYGEQYIHAEPIEQTSPKHRGWMAGGCFIYSCDSRFRQGVNAYPVSLHDRQESIR